MSEGKSGRSQGGPQLKDSEDQPIDLPERRHAEVSFDGISEDIEFSADYQTDQRRRKVNDVAANAG